jgi:hypothetical protein
MELTLNTVFDHPIADAWDGLAVRPAENHPRWDPHIELNADRSLGLGSVARRPSRPHDCMQMGGGREPRHVGKQTPAGKRHGNKWLAAMAG